MSSSEVDELPDIPEDDMITIVQRKKKHIKLSDDEVLMMLRSYQVHPCSWAKIILSMKENNHLLPDDARKMYHECSQKQLQNRLSNKFSKLMAAPEKNIKNTLIREEIRKIKVKEQSLIADPGPSKCKKSDKREELLRNLSESSEDDEPAGPSSSAQRDIRSSSAPKPSATVEFKGEKRGKKRPIMDLIRSNQEAYNQFITKKVPKLLRVLGFSDSE